MRSNLRDLEKINSSYVLGQFSDFSFSPNEISPIHMREQKLSQNWGSYIACLELAEYFPSESNITETGREDKLVSYKVGIF